MALAGDHPSHPEEVLKHDKMAWTLENVLTGARKHGASDVHLVRGIAPALRINGEIRAIEGAPLSKEDLEGILDASLNATQKEAFEREWQLCYSRHFESIGRFRVSVYYHAGCPEFSIRLCETMVRTAAELGFSDIVEELTRLPGGLILVTGPTGMGKTTTLNFMINTINHERRAK